MRRALLALLLVSCLVSCDAADGPGDPDPPVVPTPIDPATSGAVRGTVRFQGAPPPNPVLPLRGSPECAAHHSGDVRDEVVLVKDGRLRNAFVYVKSGLEKHAFAWPQEPVRISNRACLFVPRVAGVRVHQPLELVNEDPGDHNVNAYGRFNRWLRGRGASTSLKLRSPELMIKLRCDIHPWMLGWLGVVPHPFFAVTGDDGRFDFRGLPPGAYTIAAWHEKYGEKTATLTLGVSGDIPVDFVFP